eukprot:454969-Hanusia_phi.AAC.4
MGLGSRGAAEAAQRTEERTDLLPSDEAEDCGCGSFNDPSGVQHPPALWAEQPLLGHALRHLRARALKLLPQRGGGSEGMEGGRCAAVRRLLRAQRRAQVRRGRRVEKRKHGERERKGEGWRGGEGSSGSDEEEWSCGEN